MSSVRIAFIALVLLVVLNLAASDSYAQQTLSSVVCVISYKQTTIGNCIASAIPLSLIGIMLSFVLIGAAYLGGEVLNYGPLKGFFRRELWETINSMLIIVVVFTSLVVASSIATALAGKTASTSKQAGTAITDNLASLYTTVNQSYIFPQLQAAYTNFAAILGLNMGVGAWQSFSISIYTPIPVWADIFLDSGAAGVVPFKSDLITTAGTTFLPLSIISMTSTIVVIPVTLIFQFQYDLLYVIGAIGLGVFLPIGIVMRAIPFLRGIGGSMIAIGIGIAVIYPALLVGFNLPITNYIYSMKSPPVQQQGSCALQYLFCVFWNAATSLAQFGGNDIPRAMIGLAFGGRVVNMEQALQAYNNGATTGRLALYHNSLFMVMNFVIDNSLNSIVQFILFGFDIIIGYALINGIAGLLGGSISPFAKRKLKLA